MRFSVFFFWQRQGPTWELQLSPPESLQGRPSSHQQETSLTCLAAISLNTRGLISSSSFLLLFFFFCPTFYPRWAPPESGQGGTGVGEGHIFSHFTVTAWSACFHFAFLATASSVQHLFIIYPCGGGGWLTPAGNRVCRGACCRVNEGTASETVIQDPALLDLSSWGEGWPQPAARSPGA